MDDLVSYFASGEDDTTEDEITTFERTKVSCKYPRSASMYALQPLFCDETSLEEVHALAPRKLSESNHTHKIYGSNSCMDLLRVMPKQLPPEVEMGNIEYKRMLINPTPNRFEHLVTQMKWRLTGGGGSAIYRIGVDDDGHVSGLRPVELESSVRTLEQMASCLNATVHPLRECVVRSNASTPDATTLEERKALEFLVCQSPSVNDGKLDVCVAVLGGVDAGKSTLIGVLTDGELDNGRGRARLNLFRHLHEVQSGRTSSHTSEHLGFDANGRVTNYSRVNSRLTRHSIDEVLRTSTHLITLLDLAGHYKYQRTTLSGLARNQPVGALLVVSATTGLTTVGLQHAELAFGLNLPLAVIITKVDQLSDGDGCIGTRNKKIGDICSHVLQQFSKLRAAARSLKTVICSDSHRSAVSVGGVELQPRRAEDLPLFFPVSSVSGFGIDRLLRFLSRLGRNPQPDVPLSEKYMGNDTPRQQTQGNERAFCDKTQLTTAVPSTSSGVSLREMEFLVTLDRGLLEAFGPRTITLSTKSYFWVNRVFTRVPGVPDPILSGTLQTGQLKLGQRVWLGPDPSGDFRLVQIVSLMRNQQSHSVIFAGQSATVAIHLSPKLSTKVPHLEQQSHQYQNQDSPHLFFAEESKNQCAASICDDITQHRPISAHRLPSTAIRRGMVLLSADCFPAHTNENPATGAVAWTVELALTRRLLTISNQANALVVLPPLPTPPQRILLYAGCVVQNVKVVPSFTTDTQSTCGTEENMESAANHHLFVSFTRGPEYLEVGRQVVISWAGCATAVGHVAALHDVVPPPNVYGKQTGTPNFFLPPSTSPLVKTSNLSDHLEHSILSAMTKPSLLDDQPTVDAGEVPRTSTPEHHVPRTSLIDSLSVHLLSSSLPDRVTEITNKSTLSVLQEHEEFHVDAKDVNRHLSGDDNHGVPTSSSTPIAVSSKANADYCFSGKKSAEYKRRRRRKK